VIEDAVTQHRIFKLLFLKNVDYFSIYAINNIIKIDISRYIFETTLSTFKHKEILL